MKKKLIVLVIIAIVVAGAAYAGWRFWSKRGESNSIAALKWNVAI